MFIAGAPLRLVVIPGHGAWAIADIASTQPVDVVVLAGDPYAKLELCRSPELWGCTILVVPADGPDEL